MAVSKVVVLGAGVAGLATAMLLAGDGHEVTVLERDPALPPGDPRDAWADWERRGVNQFRLVHFFQPRFRQLAEAELPGVIDALEEAGALRINFVAGVPAEITGGFRDSDEAFTAVTGRRPFVEAALASVAGGWPGVTVRRGVAVGGLLTGAEASPGTPHVTGVRTADGEEISADLVVDVSGRRSGLPRWLEAAGAPPLPEEAEDCGFVYYGRHFSSGDGSLPPFLGPPLGHYGSVSLLTLPADNGSWGVVFVAAADDAELRGLRSVERWEAALKTFPLIAHWADGEPIDREVVVMARIEDRIRHFVVDGRPLATGVVAVGDAWACTNPSLGRGASLGVVHAVALRDMLRLVGTEDPNALALAWEEATESTVAPWYRDTLHFDRHRLAEAQAAARGEAYEPDDELWDTVRALEFASGMDPELFRGFVSVAALLALRDEVLARPGVLDKARTLGAGWRDAGWLGPTRAELVKLANG
jgi:2-polyprenyl-6-methoxyphenol hydroxylase-like FAD-dependent oxidoreductase